MRRRLEVYQPNWSWDDRTEDWLRAQCIGRTLNFPCGKSQVGDVRADADPSLEPDVIADLYKPYDKFERGEFDTVVCDPPFSYYNRQRWIAPLSQLARKRFILSSPMNISLKRGVWKKSLYVTIERGKFFIRVWFIFDRIMNPLDPCTQPAKAVAMLPDGSSIPVPAGAPPELVPGGSAGMPRGANRFQVHYLLPSGGSDMDETCRLPSISTYVDHWDVTTSNDIPDICHSPSKLTGFGGAEVTTSFDLPDHLPTSMFAAPKIHYPEDYPNSYCVPCSSFSSTSGEVGGVVHEHGHGHPPLTDPMLHAPRFRRELEARTGYMMLCQKLSKPSRLFIHQKATKRGVTA